jgi:hypothetical protein
VSGLKRCSFVVRPNASQFSPWTVSASAASSTTVRAGSSGPHAASPTRIAEHAAVLAHRTAAPSIKRSALR